ncbi:glutaredoxin-related family protein [Heterostelium album PN500]|uniref:Glutaredoxin-related family protein n=1 Tax=Heterostelium pallidum (strain ATCC 26659 / Pp 5 / PN500) TaxID=670386 RepID=D3AXK3_HETP5|nr:glutaredoxin-related family protein [Heterostelium album PN500]EFA86272.1 glutaredoxin-related family protein [Heterostelium album PN500]|eukprot:XP_020438377.1 glutaredoxin-related family protein [Heterostelium album PN500]
MSVGYTGRFLVGGLHSTNIVRENGVRSFSRYYSSVKDEYQKKIADQVKEFPCVLYMKGTPERPMCGFSNTVIRILEAEGATFKSHNVLEDDDLRENIKSFSNWPTIPQVYIKGEFVGGADIMMNMYKTGELSKMLEDAGVVEKQ